METENGWFDRYLSLLAAETLARRADAEDLKRSGLFQPGEVVELRGSRFRVVNITHAHMTLRRIPQADAEISE